MDDAAWDATVFTKNRDRQLDGEVVRAFFEAVLAQAKAKQLPSREHFTRLARLKGKESKLAYRGHLLTENRHGLVVDARLMAADGHAEREAALAMIEEIRDVSRSCSGPTAATTCAPSWRGGAASR